MDYTSFISPDAQISNCVLGLKTRIYKNANIKNSSLKDFVSIGDSTDIIDCDIDSNVSINRRNYIFKSVIGRFCYTGIGTMIRSSEVGNFCSISWNVSIGGGDHPKENVTTGNLNRFYQLDAGMWDDKSKKELAKVFSKQKQCIIKNDVLISSNVTILRNITIGNGAIIGAGAVVTKDVEPYSIVAGVPAKLIRKRFDDKTIEALERIQWWNWPIEIIRENLELIYSTKVDKKVICKMFEISKNIQG